jgi:hypothetical protein
MPQDPNATYDAVADDIVATSEATRSKMFGMPCLKIGGRAFAGFSQGSMVFKLRGDAHARAIALPGARAFDPMGGRPMKEWVAVPAEQATHWTELAHLALANVAGAL